MRAVCIGECMVELAPAGDGLLKQGFAGDTFNTAWYLKRLQPDWAVDYLSAVGADAISDAMLAFMAKAGIGTARVQRRGDRTVGLYLISLTDGERSFSYWRGQSAARTLADEPAALKQGLEGAGLAMFSGITLAILSPERRAVLLAALRASGARIAFDPNMRPRLWSGPGEMAAAVFEAAGVADTVLPSFDEEAALQGDAGPEATLARYRSMGPGTVVVKNGGGRIWAWDRDEGLVSFDPAPVTPVDTTAAGDSFNAGFLAARAGGAGLREAVAAGSALAGRVILHPGALVG
jgi:2-dehydro-3-deoxygluconokinase